MGECNIKDVGQRLEREHYILYNASRNAMIITIKCENVAVPT